MGKVEDGQVEMVVAEDGLLEQDLHLELDRHLDAAEVVDRRKYEPPFSPRDCLLQAGGEVMAG